MNPLLLKCLPSPLPQPGTSSLHSAGSAWVYAQIFNTAPVPVVCDQSSLSRSIPVLDGRAPSGWLLRGILEAPGARHDSS